MVAGLRALERGGLVAVLVDAVESAIKCSRELGQEVEASLKTGK
jgi:pyrroline-5-carboxylate reductase